MALHCLLPGGHNQYLLLLPGTFIKAGKHADAVGMLLRFAAACETTNASTSQCKCFLGAVVVWLFAGDGTQAWAVYQV